MSFWCLQIDQKNNEIFVRISALASKKRLNKRYKGTIKMNNIVSIYFLFLNIKNSGDQKYMQ